MRKSLYTKPMLLGAFASDPFDITPSQGGQGGGYDLAKWNEWWNVFSDIVLEIYSNFDINNKYTWPEGFDPGDSETWDVLFGGEE